MKATLVVKELGILDHKAIQVAKAILVVELSQVVKELDLQDLRVTLVVEVL